MTSRSAWWAAIAIARAVPNWPPASVPDGAVDEEPERRVVGARQGVHGREARVDEPAVVVGGLRDDPVGLRVHRRRDRLARPPQLADRPIARP